MEGMFSYTQAAMERTMKVQEVILRALAKKIRWWQAAEIIGISDRQMRRWHERHEEFGVWGLFDGGGGETGAQEGAIGGGGESPGAVSGKVFRSERAALSREVAGRAPGGDQLQLGEGVAARGGDGGEGPQTGSASQAASAASAAGAAAAHRWQRASLVPG